MKKLLPVLLLLVFAACSTPASKIGLIKIGMPRAEVIAILGSPVSTGQDGDIETLNYKMAESVADYSHSFWGGQPYYVKLKDGKVEAYGRR